MEPPGVRSFYAEGRRRSDRLFRRARRHSRFIRVLRGAIPAGIVCILAVIVGLAYFKPFQVIANLPLDPGKLVVSGTKVTMEQPRLGGFTRDNKPYELTARAAAQDLRKPGLIELTDLQGRVKTQDDATLDLSAINGVYDSKTDVLKLADDIQLHSSTGMEARLSEATVDMKKGTIVSESPVEVKMATGTVNANRLEVTESGASVKFHGGVQTYLLMGEPRETRKASAQ
jgi:lipopolysaccharide export system protein LptC